jgi:putative addiction module CopG family antidote
VDITLSAEQLRFVDEQVRSGRYVDASDVVRDAMRLLEAREATVSARNFTALGSMAEGDIMAIAFIVLMQAAKSAKEDLKAIMEGVKAINDAKKKMRDLLAGVSRDVAANAGRARGAALDFSHGLGSERAYHAVPIPHVDPEAPGGVREVPADLFPGTVKRCADLAAVAADLRNRLDSFSDMGEMESLRLQMAMDRMSKMMTTLSNLLKKSSDTASTVIDNLK